MSLLQCVWSCFFNPILLFWCFHFISIVWINMAAVTTTHTATDIYHTTCYNVDDSTISRISQEYINDKLAVVNGTIEAFGKTINYLVDDWYHNYLTLVNMQQEFERNVTSWNSTIYNQLYQWNTTFNYTLDTIANNFYTFETNDDNDSMADGVYKNLTIDYKIFEPLFHISRHTNWRKKLQPTINSTITDISLPSLQLHSSSSSSKKLTKQSTQKSKKGYNHTIIILALYFVFVILDICNCTLRFHLERHLFNKNYALLVESATTNDKTFAKTRHQVLQILDRVRNGYSHSLSQHIRLRQPILWWVGHNGKHLWILILAAAIQYKLIVTPNSNTLVSKRSTCPTTLMEIVQSSTEFQSNLNTTITAFYKDSIQQSVTSTNSQMTALINEINAQSTLFTLPAWENVTYIPSLPSTPADTYFLQSILQNTLPLEQTATSNSTKSTILAPKNSMRPTLKWLLISSTIIALFYHTIGLLVFIKLD